MTQVLAQKYSLAIVAELVLEAEPYAFTIGASLTFSIAFDTCYELPGAF